MSDYLNNLAARSTGRVEQFRPRLPALFEPASGRARSSSIPRYALEDAGIDHVEDAQVSTDQDWRTSDAAARDRPSERGMVRPRGPDVADEPDTPNQWRTRISGASRRALGRAEPDQEARWQREQLQHENEVKTRTGAPTDFHDSSPAHLEESPNGPARVRTETATARHNRSAAPSPAPIPDQIRNDRHSPDWGMPAKAPIGLAGQSLDQPLDLRLNLARSLFSPGHSSTEFETADDGRVEKGAAISTYYEAAAPLERRGVPAGPFGPQRAPTIKVTIGRVEVRAIVNDSKPPRQESAKAKPRMTLDEYLKQGDGGHR